MIGMYDAIKFLKQAAMQEIPNPQDLALIGVYVDYLAAGPRQRANDLLCLFVPVISRLVVETTQLSCLLFKNDYSPWTQFKTS